VRHVLDCSVAVKLFVPEAGSDLADECLVQQEAGRISFIAPDVLVAEFGHTLRKHVLGGATTC
jgi:predicted nucleic acid-binding protein